MPRPRKSLIRSQLSRSHLEAIGQVCAEWSALEIRLINGIARLTDVPVLKTILLAGPATLDSWLDMIMVSVKTSPSHFISVDAFNDVNRLIQKLRTLRNHAVHASWNVRSRGSDLGLLGTVVLIDVRHDDYAEGLGIPKRGQEVLISVRWTAKQLRQVADLIREAGRIFSGLVDRRLPASDKEQIAHMLLDQTIQARIRTMLDSLPSPYPPSPTKKSRQRAAQKGVV